LKSSRLLGSFTLGNDRRGKHPPLNYLGPLFYLNQEDLMRLAAIEKLVVALIVVMVLLIAGSVGCFVYVISEAGGCRGVVIEVGKGIKDISSEINKD
jgi:hypothetical protein